MAKKYTVTNGKRVIFQKGEQREFLAQALKESSLSTRELSGVLSVHPRTFNSWQNEHSTLPLSSLETICTKFKIKQPKKIEVRDAFWSTKKAAVLGGRATFKKYGSVGGSPEHRKSEWQKWWKNTGHNNLPASFQSLRIKMPRKNKGLAEFIGILLGDGHVGISQVTITINATDDLLYAQYTAALIKKLFDVDPSISKRKNMNAIVISVSRKKLIEFLSTLGIYPGNKTKQQVDIPNWIKKIQPFSMMCVRGLMDTDGCVVNECHTINSKKYCYPRLVFTNVSQPLLQSVFEILKRLDFSPKMRNNRRVQIEKGAEISRYFKIIGTSNPKHLARFKRFGLGK